MLLAEFPVQRNKTLFTALTPLIKPIEPSVKKAHADSCHEISHLMLQFHDRQVTLE